MKNDQEIIVIGAGIIGASIAWRLDQAGASVTLIDADEPGGTASRNSFGWINATYGNPRHYFDLRIAAMKEWDLLAQQLDGLPYQKKGTLYAYFDRVDLLSFQIEHSRWGYEIDWLSRREIESLEPNLIDIPERGLFAPTESTVQVEHAAQYFTEIFQRDGGKFVRTRVVGLFKENSHVLRVETANGNLNADHIVLAAGAATQALADKLGIAIPMTTPAGLLVHTKPCAPIIKRTVLTRGLHVQQRPDGSLLAGTDFGGGNHIEQPEECARDLMNRIRTAFKGTEGVELDRYMLGYRPTPEDGMPVVGASAKVPGLYIAVMHSGATLAPIVAKFACDEILSGNLAELLTPFRPDRYSSSVETNTG